MYTHVDTLIKTASVRELRSRTAELIDSDEPVLVTRNGKNAALLYPLHDPNKVPLEVRRALFVEMTAKIGKQLGPGVTEDEIARDFAAYQKRRR